MQTLVNVAIGIEISESSKDQEELNKRSLAHPQFFESIP